MTDTETRGRGEQMQKDALHDKAAPGGVGLNNLSIIIFSGFKRAEFDPNILINPYI